MATPAEATNTYSHEPATMSYEVLRSSWEEFLRKYMRSEIDRVALAYPEQSSILVPYWQLSKHSDRLADATLEFPDESLDAAREAARSLETPVDEPLKLSIRVDRLPEHWLIPVRELRAEHLGRLLAIRGLVRKASEVRPRLEVGAFQCLRCGHLEYVEQDEHLTFKEPQGCVQCEKKSAFKFLEARSTYVDTQRLELQEAPEGLRGGEQPERIIAYVEDDLAGHVAPGDRIVLNGVLRSHQRRLHGQPSTLFDLFSDVNSIEIQEQEFEEVQISDEEIEEIVEFSRDPDLYTKIVHSLAPTIHGMDMEKQAMALQLFGGVAKHMSDGSRIRGDIHMLLVGDPGVAKSQLLRYAARISPRSVYTSGKSSSAAGLTAAAVRDEMADGRWTLEAGALVLADKGLCAVDEIDKMNKNDQSSMHEAMEQQSYHPGTELWLADGRRAKMGAFVDQLLAEHPDQVQRTGTHAGQDGDADEPACEVLDVDGLRVHSVDPLTHEAAKVPVARVSRHKAPDRFVRITFSNGRNVLVTPEHPVYVADGDGLATVPAEDVEPGSWAPAPRKVPNEAAAVDLQDEAWAGGRERDVRLPSRLTPELAEALGLLVAEGHTYAGSSHEVGFSNTDPRLLERMAELMGSLFGLEPSNVVNERGTVTQRWISTKLHRWFLSNFPELTHPSRSKRIPAVVLGASEAIIERFLAGAFAGDGSVETSAVGLSTASRGLARDYADALLKLGITSRIHPNRGQETWKTYITGDGLEAALGRIIPPSDDRWGRVAQLAARGQANPRHHDVLPTAAARELRALRRLLGLPLTGRWKPHLDQGHGVQVERVRRELDALRERVRQVRDDLASATTLAEVRSAIGWSCRTLATQMAGSTRGRQIWYAEQGGYGASERAEMTERATHAIRAALREAEQRARRLEHRADLRYHRITAVEEVANAGELACEWVYDVTVEPTHTFVGEGVILHNTISIAKAGITAELQSRCAILGAANPKFGRFDPNQPLAEQITMPPALMSRFDVIFTLRDEPAQEKDNNLAHHIMQVHRAGAIKEYRERHEDGIYTLEDEEDANLVTEPPVTREFLRKYIAFSKRTTFPVLTEEALGHLQEYYVKIRAEGASEQGGRIPLTPRQLEALVRLTEASARIRLSNRAETEDAKRAIDIVEYWLRRISGGTGLMDIDLVASGVGHSQRERIRILIDVIRELSEEHPEGAPIEEILAVASERGITEAQVDETIRMLKNQRGTIYSPDNDDHYKLVRE